jgi:Sulfotransferase domain
VDDAVRPTAARTPQKRVPDFFLVGHPKGGTTALYEMLRRHPQIYMSDVKEPNFFTAEWRTRDGPPEAFDDYLSLFHAAKPEQRIGEASACYLVSRNAASGIAAVQPAAQIVAILREPVSFLRSLHLQFVQDDFETEKNLRKALSLEDARRQGRHVPHSAPNWQHRLIYSDYVRYVEQLHRYHALFPSEQVMVLIYDDFRRDNEATVRKVLSFLDVDDMSPIQPSEINHTVRVRFRHLNHIIYAVSREQGPAWRVAKAVKVLTPRRLRRYLWQSRYRLIHGDPPPPDERLMVELRRRFKPEVVALSEYLDRDLVALWGYDSIG